MIISLSLFFAFWGRSLPLVMPLEEEGGGHSQSESVGRLCLGQLLTLRTPCSQGCVPYMCVCVCVCVFDGNQ